MTSTSSTPQATSGGHTYPVTIESELKRSFVDYAMSVIMGRALPDVRDGLKPVNRRILYAMYQLNNYHNKPYKKSARVVGDVIGKYHPHGDSSVYQALVRMAQDFSLRYPLVDGQGNFGSVDGDAAAAMRYTEVRMAKLTQTMIDELDKDTVDFEPNYDNTEFAPMLLPCRFPNILVNGSSGIAVGMATNIPPHNLGEVIDALVALIDDPSLTVEDLCQHVKGPDFPTSAVLFGLQGIRQAYATGRGKIYIKARSTIETDAQGKESIVVTELPYQVNKARLIEKIADLVKEKKVEGITAIRDESDKQGTRVVIECRRGEHSEVILNKLVSMTQLQVAFSMNFVVIHDGQPKCMNLRDILRAFITHRKEVVTRRTRYLLTRVKEKAHALEGLVIALDNLDDVIDLIKRAESPAQAKVQLLEKAWPISGSEHLLRATSMKLDLDEPYGLDEKSQYYRLSALQVQAILDMRLHKLTGLERTKILEDFKQCIEEAMALEEILNDPRCLMRNIRDDLVDLKERFADERKTEIVADYNNVEEEDLIPNHQIMVSLSNVGYLKSQTLESYQLQHRGGKGKAVSNVKNEEIIVDLQVCHAHDTLLFFSTSGRVYWLKSFRIPLLSRGARGRPVNNYLQLDEDEKISAILPLTTLKTEANILMVTAMGYLKKVKMTDFSRPRANGIIALHLEEGDQLVSALPIEEGHQVMLFSSSGKVTTFSESGIRTMGRQARGVRGMMLGQDESIIASLVIDDASREILTISEKGYGKRNAVSDFRVTSRGTKGVAAMKCTDKTGPLVSASLVNTDDELLVLTHQGVMVRIAVASISVLGRVTQGVRLINIQTNDRVVGIQQIEASDEVSVEGQDPSTLDDTAN